MSRTLAIVTAILTILRSYVSAQAPTCLSGYQWSFNSMNQSPCTMTVALGGACVNGAFTLDPLQEGFVYLGPTVLAANSCRCSTVYYSLLSACAYCQNQTYLDWSIYNVNCTTVYNETFLDPLPLVIPHYAYLDVTADNSFNVLAAQRAGGPESSPVSQPTSTSTTPISTSSHTTVAPSSKKLNVGAIAGGVAGGVAFIGIIGGLVAFFLRRRKASVSTPSTYTAYASPQTMMSDSDMKYNSTVPSGKLYDPNDPTTFPSGYSNGLPQHPNDPSAFASDPLSYSTYSGSPQGVTPTITGNATLVGHGNGPVPVRTTQYTGAPEL